MISVNDKKELIYLGVQGENVARYIEFDFYDWAREYGAGTLELMNRRNGESMAYLVDLAMYGETAMWDVSNKDNAKAGFGSCQLRYKVNDVVVKTATFRTMVDAAIDSIDDDSATPYEDVLTEIDSKIDTASALVDEAVDTVSAIINLTVSSELGDKAAVEKHVDPETGEIHLHFTLETGPQGEKGDTGATGNGIESIVLNDNYTLTINFTDGTSYTTGSIRGLQGERGIQGIQGPQGPQGDDYVLTSSDKTQIASLVYAMFTTAEGGSY